MPTDIYWPAITPSHSLSIVRTVTPRPMPPTLYPRGGRQRQQRGAAADSEAKATVAALVGTGGHATAAGSRLSCWLSQGCCAPSPSRALCCLLCLTIAEEERKKEKESRLAKKWPYTHRFPPGRLARRERQTRSTYCCSGTPPLLDCITLHSRACACLYMSDIRMCANSTCSFYRVVPPAGPGGWRGMMDRGRGPARPPWQPLRWRLGWNFWKDMLLPLALAGPAGDLENAVLRRRPGCYIANRV